MKKVQIKYDELEDIARRAESSAQHVEGLTRRLVAQLEALRGEGWAGRGSEAFYREMDGLMLPAMHKLARALEALGGGLRRAGDVFREAEQNAANLFKGGGISGGSGRLGGGIGTGSGSVGGGSSPRGANYTGFLGKVFAGIKKAFPDQIDGLTSKIVDRAKSLLPKLFSGGGGGSGMLGKVAKKIPFIPIGMGIYEHFSQPAEQRTWQGLVGQIGSGVAQTLVNLTPVGWVDIGTQVIGGAVQIGGEVYGGITGRDTSGFVDTVRDITDAVSFDNLFDKAFTTVAENPSLVVGQTFSSMVDGVQQWNTLPEGERTARNFAVQTISALLQPNQAMTVASAEYVAEYQAKLNNQDPQAAIANARRDTQAMLDLSDRATDQVVSDGIQQVSNFFSGAFQRLGL